MSLKKIAQEIKKNKRFLITAHVNLEADALGSELAFSRLLKKLGKTGFVVNESKVSADCKFLPGINEILPVSKAAKKFDCAVFLDCSDSSRAGEAAKLAGENILTLNIDHHISNSYFADVNWVDPQASCACELVYRLYRYFKLPIEKDVAVMLYAGIVADTGSFRFNNTSSASLRIAADLIKSGVSAALVYRGLYEVNSFEEVRFLGSILSTLKSDPTGRIVWAEISLKGLCGKSTSVDLSEIVLALMRSIKGVELAMVFKNIRDTKSQVRVNFRSQNNFDCNHLASQFGGGGHKNASGATVSGDISAVKTRIVRYAKKLMRDYV